MSAGSDVRAAERRLSAPTAPRSDLPAEENVLEVLFEGPSVRLAAWRCPVREREWSDERIQSVDSVAFPRDVPFAIHSEGESVVADRSAVLLHSAGVPYRTSHPFGTGDRGLVLTPLAGSVADRGFRGPAVSGARPLHVLRSPRAQLLQEVLFRRATPDEPEAVEELSRQLLAETSRCARGALGPRSRRLKTAVERVRARLGRDLKTKVRLAELAGEVGYSPFHVARVFRRITGVSIRRYRLRARLFAALPRILERRSDIMEIALDLGFSSHSHLTAAFRDEFGLSPSDLRLLVREESLGAIAARLRPASRGC